MSRRLVSIADAAVTCLEGAIQNGDIRAALSVLKGIGALDGVVPSFGATSPRRLELDAKHEEAQLELEEILTN